MIRILCEPTTLKAIDIANRLRPVDLVQSDRDDVPQPDLVEADLPDRNPAGTFVFLDSGFVDVCQGRFAIIGRNPWYNCQVIEGQTLVNDQPQACNILAAVRQFIQMYKADLPNGQLPPEIPFTAGLIGYFAYDLAIQMSRGQIQLPAASDLACPQAWLTAFDQMAIVDQVENLIYLLAWGKLMDPVLAIEQLQKDIRQPSFQRIDWPTPASESALPVPGKADRSVWAERSNFSHSAFCQRVEDVRRAIAGGEVYILNLTQRFLLPQSPNPWKSYCQLRQVSPTAYAAYIQAGECQVLSFSMEQFLRVRDRKVTTRPIKGTRPRGQTPAEDERNRQELLSSRKDQAELLMIVDLERNDLSRVCEPTSVMVEDLFQLETYSTVYHLVATVSGQLAEGEDAISCFQACFPGGSITGAPKIRAMQLISEFEQLRRGLYTGCLGYFSLDGQADFSIMIRTLVSDGHKTTYHAGGGITWDSDPEAEYQETLDKASAIGGVLSC